MRFSIIIPTFDRRPLLGHAIDSSLAFARAVGDTETIVVDDASRDGTADMVRDRYAREIDDGSVKLIELRTNGGVTAARNKACSLAQGDWLVFLDSDDQFTSGATISIPAFAERHANAPLLLFRCEDEAGRLIGPPMPAGPLDLAAMLTQGTPGECLPVPRRTAFLAQPYDEDLRGFELLAYLRIVAANGPAMLSDAVVRLYATTGADRLSSNAGRLRRAGRLAQGYSRMLGEFGSRLLPRRRLALLLRIVCYRLAAAVLGSGR